MCHKKVKPPIIVLIYIIAVINIIVVIYMIVVIYYCRNLDYFRHPLIWTSSLTRTIKRSLSPDQCSDFNNISYYSILC